MMDTGRVAVSKCSLSASSSSSSFPQQQELHHHCHNILAQHKMAAKYCGAIVKLCEEHGIPPEAARLGASEPRKQLFLLTPGDITSSSCIHGEKPTDATSAADTENGFLFCIPNGWKVAAKLDDRVFVGQTSYEMERVLFKFDMLHEASGAVLASSEWDPSPIKAFISLIPSNPLPKFNGQAVIGLMNESSQRLLREYFGSRKQEYSLALQTEIDKWLATPIKSDQKPLLPPAAVGAMPSQSGRIPLQQQQHQRFQEFLNNTSAEDSSAIVEDGKRAKLQQQPATVYYPYNTLQNLYQTAHGQSFKFALHEFFALLPQFPRPAIARVFVNCQLELDHRIFEKDFFRFLDDVEAVAADTFASASKLDGMAKIDPRMPSTHKDRVMMFVQSRRVAAAVADKENYIYYITQLPPSSTVRAIMRGNFNQAVEQQNH